MANPLTQVNKRVGIQAPVLIFVLAILSLTVARAQQSGGTIAGAVTDPSGAAVAGANVTIRNVATRVERSVPTNEDGLYTAPSLVPGTYEVTVNAPGFSSTVVSDVVLTVGERREVNVALKIGQTSEKVTVLGSGISDVQLATSSVGNVVDSHTVVELPLNGRDWTSHDLSAAGRRPGAHPKSTRRQQRPAQSRLGSGCNDQRQSAAGK